MTVIEFLRTASVEEIANEVFDEEGERNGRSFKDWRAGFTFNPYFAEDYDCPEECRYLELEANYEDSWMNGMCWLSSEIELGVEKCPYGIDRRQSKIKQLIEWLNMDIEAKEES